VPKFSAPSSTDLNKTLARKFIPLADKLRDLMTKFGLRQYEVHVVRSRWSGGRRGAGQESVVSDVVVLPTPKIMDLTGLQEIANPTGLTEVGSVRVTEISGSYTESQLRGLDTDGTSPNRDEQVFYEIHFILPNGEAQRRRFLLRSAPFYEAGKLQWSLVLEKAQEDRDESGGLR
jgi:hypothetical protein